MAAARLPPAYLHFGTLGRKQAMPQTQGMSQCRAPDLQLLPLTSRSAPVPPGHAGGEALWPPLRCMPCWPQPPPRGLRTGRQGRQEVSGVASMQSLDRADMMHARHPKCQAVGTPEQPAHPLHISPTQQGLPI